MSSLVRNADQQTQALSLKARKFNAVPGQMFLSYLILKFTFGFDTNLLHLEQEF
jgi:hypothetical protein